MNLASDEFRISVDMSTGNDTACINIYHIKDDVITLDNVLYGDEALDFICNYLESGEEE